MESIDLNIENYTFDDILQLFKLSNNYGFNDLNEKKNILRKINPENSKLDKKYYEFFLKAYNILDEKLNEQIILDIKKNQIVSEKEFNDNTFIQNSLLVNSDNKNSCYKPYDYIIQIASIHTEDRDILKYPYPNSFEVELPQVFKNVLSLELYDIQLPRYYYNISEYMQNTALWFSLPYFSVEPIELRMLSGYYTHTTFPEELENALNKRTTELVYSLGAYTTNVMEYSYFKVKLNQYNNKLEIYNSKHEYKFWCQKRSTYDDDCVRDNWYFNKNWGLPYNMGFYRFLYCSTYDISNNVFVLVSPDIISIGINETIYMEIDKFNYINEIVPYSINTSELYNNDYNGIVNSAFAKLILSNVTDSYVPVKKFKRILPHIEGKISKLKFKFRYHNGKLVDFLNQNFNFSIKFVTQFECKYTS